MAFRAVLADGAGVVPAQGLLEKQQGGGGIVVQVAHEGFLGQRVGLGLGIRGEFLITQQILFRLAEIGPQDADVNDGQVGPIHAVVQADGIDLAVLRLDVIAHVVFFFFFFFFFFFVVVVVFLFFSTGSVTYAE